MRIKKEDWDELEKPKITRGSLRWKLIIIAVLCWMIPLLSVVTIMTTDMKRNRKDQLEGEYAVAVTHSASLVGRSLSEAITSSREASYNPTLRQAYQSYRKSKDLTQLAEQTNRLLTSTYRYSATALTTIIFYTEEVSRHHYTYNTTMRGSYENYQYYVREVHHQVIERSADLDTKIGFLVVGNRLYMMRNIVDSNFSTYAVIVMELNQKEIFRPFLHLPREKGVLLELNDVAFYPNGVPEGLEELQDTVCPFIPVGKARVTLGNNRAIICGKERVDGLKFDYTVRVEDPSIAERLSQYSGMFYISIAVLVLLLIYVFRFSFLNILHPMKRLQEAAHLIEKGEFGYRIQEEQPNAEFTSLTNSVNEMSEQLKKQFEQIYSEELALRDARIMALQSQINPHFLNNTLEIINWEARIAENHKVSHMIESLSVMLDAVTDRKSAPLIPLQQELDYVDAYLYIISQRFGDRLQIQKNVDSSLLSQKVPCLMLQPIVENAIEHGMIGGQVCQIAIASEVQGKYLHLSITNNAPLSQEDQIIIERLLSPEGPREEYSTKMGIYNVNARLKILYHEDAGLQIITTTTDTIATIHLPLDDVT